MGSSLLSRQGRSATLTVNANGDSNNEQASSPTVAAFSRHSQVVGFPGGTSSKEPVCQCRRKEMATHSSILAWEISQRSLAGYNPWGHKESDIT